MRNTKFELDLLKQENTRLLIRIAKLEQTVKEKDELIARIVELERYKSDTVNLKTENIELRDRITKLEQKQLQDSSKSLVNTAPTKIVKSNDTSASEITNVISNSDDTSEQEEVLQNKDAPASDVSNNVSNSDSLT